MATAAPVIESVDALSYEMLSCTSVTCPYSNALVALGISSVTSISSSSPLLNCAIATSALSRSNTRNIFCRRSAPMVGDVSVGMKEVAHKRSPSESISS